MKLKSGDIILIQNTRFISKIIRFITNSKWSHSESVIIDENELMLIGANETGVKFKDFNTYLSNKPRIAILRYKGDLNYHNVNLIAKYTVGTEYDFKSLLFYQLYMQLFHKWKGYKGKAATNKFYCSELSGYLIGLKDWWNKSPQDLYKNNQLELLFEGSFDEYNKKQAINK